MTAAAQVENPFAGQGSVLLDIGGDVGALVVTMPEGMEGVEIEIRPEGSGASAHVHHHHHEHVAVVNRPAGGARIPSLVFPELLEGSYELYEKGTHHVRLTVAVRGGEVATAAWRT
ncbi:MAG TPA: hypothetical protein VFT00_04320 [Nocardioides sp.]|nr:hypothetical protein [Nocardioides sp.]